MNKKLLSGIMSGVMLAGSCSAVGAEAPKGIKNSVSNFVSNNKLVIGGGILGTTAIGGTIAWLVLHNRDLKVDFNVFKQFDARLVEAVKAFRNSLTVEHVTVAEASKVREDLAKAFTEELSEAKDEKAKKAVLVISKEISGIKDLANEVEGALVLKKVTKEDKSVEVTFEFKKVEKKEDKKEEAKEEAKAEEKKEAAEPVKAETKKDEKTGDKKDATEPVKTETEKADA